MFTITPTQIEWLEASIAASTQQRVLAAASTRWQQPLVVLAPQFTPVVTTLQMLGFTTDAELSAGLDLARMHGIDFHRQAWAAPFFTKVPVDHPAGTLLYLQALAPQGA